MCFEDGRLCCFSRVGNKGFGEMVMHSRVSGSSLVSDSFKKPRTISRVKPLPTGTIASEKLEYIEESFLPDNFTLY